MPEIMFTSTVDKREKKKKESHSREVFSSNRRLLQLYQGLCNMAE